MKRKVFDRAFAIEAVRLVLQWGMTCAQLARDLDISRLAYVSAPWLTTEKWYERRSYRRPMRHAGRR